MLKPVLENFLRSIFLLIITSCFSTSVHAVENKPDAPLTIEGTTKVTAEEIFSLVEKFPGLVIIDARIKTDRIQGYIESSVSLPDIKTTCPALNKVVSNKTTPVLFYCNGVKCGRSGNSAKIALKCGYKNLYWFRGGFEEWKHKKLPFIKK